MWKLELLQVEVTYFMKLDILSALEEKDVYCNISDVMPTNFIHFYSCLFIFFYFYLKLL